MMRVYVYRCECGATRELSERVDVTVCDCGAKMRRDYRAEGGKEHYHPSRTEKPRKGKR